MKKTIIASMLALTLIAVPGFAAAQKIIVQREVAYAKHQENSAASGIVKDNRLSSKRIKDKTEMTNAQVKDAAGHNVIRYKTFKDGEGVAKTR